MAFAACLLPAADLIRRALTPDGLGANPIEEAEIFTGLWTLRFVAITLAVTPARRLLGLGFLARYRRMFGLFAFFYAVVHLSMWVGVDWFFAWRLMGREIAKHRYILVGMASFLLLLPLAFTSTNASVRRLGGRRWARLHRLVVSRRHRGHGPLPLGGEEGHAVPAGVPRRVRRVARLPPGRAVVAATRGSRPRAPPVSRTPPSSAANSPYACFAIAAPGLEPLVAAELAALGEAPQAEAGGVAWTGDAASLLRGNLWLRTASRVVVRAAEFKARTFYELERHARRVPWERFVAAGGSVRFRVTCRKSRLYHSDAVAERLAAAIEHRLGAASAFTARESADDEELDTPGREQLFVVRMAHDVCTVSADSSGALLHLRGYRQAVARAPLRETLAAALLLSADWRGTVPLVDPLCGSGTIPIEGALIARDIAPGLRRQFACTAWPGFPREVLAQALAAAEARIRPAVAAPILGSDRDAGAIDAARANAERAGVGADVAFSVRAISAVEPPAGPGLAATNPPYGVRVGERHEIRNLYAQLGHVLRRQCGGWRVALFSPDARLTQQIGIPLAVAASTTNGGIAVRIEMGDVPAAPAPARIYF